LSHGDIALFLQKLQHDMGIIKKAAGDIPAGGAAGKLIV